LISLNFNNHFSLFVKSGYHKVSSIRFVCKMLHHVCILSQFFKHVERQLFNSKQNLAPCLKERNRKCNLLACLRRTYIEDEKPIIWRFHGEHMLAESFLCAHRSVVEAWLVLYWTGLRNIFEKTSFYLIIFTNNMAQFFTHFQFTSRCPISQSGLCSPRSIDFGKNASAMHRT
jgi:hypothetical protein